MKHIVFLILMTHSVIASGIDSLNYYNAEIRRAYKENSQKLPDIYRQKLAYLKSKDNLEEFIYAHIDFFLLEPSGERQKFLQNYFLEKWRDAATPDELIAELHLIVNTAYYQQCTGLITQANDAYENAYTYWLEHKVAGYDIVEYCLKPLANNYTRLGDPIRAEDLLRNALMIAISTNQKQQISSVLNNLAIAYRTLGQPDKGINVLSEVLKIAGNNNEQKALIESNIARLYINSQNFDQAIINANASDRWQAGAQTPVSETTFKNCLTRMMAYHHLQENSKAEKEIVSIKKLLPQIYENGNREIAKTYNQLAEFYASSGDLETAFTCYETSLNTLLPGYLTNHVETLYPEVAILETFDGMANLFKLQKNYKAALQCYDKAFEVAAMLRHSYAFQESKVNQQYENHIRSEKAINASWELFREESNYRWLEKAFQYADRSKSAVLEEELQSKYINSNIKTDPLIQEKVNLQFEKGVLNKKIILEKAKLKQTNIALLESLIAKRNQNDLKQKKIQTKLSNKYPNLFYSQKKSLTIKSIQDSLLSSSQQLIEFFEGEESIYIFSVTPKGKLNVQRIVYPDSVKLKIAHFYENLTADFGQRILNNPIEYTKSAYEIYQALLEKQIESPRYNELIIIPDGSISFVPFDALLTQAISSSNFQKMPFLLKSKQISYASSASVLYHQKQHYKNKNTNQFKVLGFFPVFENGVRNMGELKYSEDEAQGIETQFKGTYLLKNEAKKDKFVHFNVNYDILHLSTHASAGNGTIPPFIEFYESTLFLSEIYGFNLQPRLLVLSACETGIGKIKKGEGVMSLARGFQYAGVNNIIVSQWKVNDKATAELMSLFYKNYKTDDNQHQALAQAQIDYLNDPDIPNSKKSPYYWAGFISIGELTAENTTPWRIILLAIALSFLLLIVSLRRKNVL